MLLPLSQATTHTIKGTTGTPRFNSKVTLNRHVSLQRRPTSKQLDVDGGGRVSSDINISGGCYGTVIQHQFSRVITAAQMTQQQAATADLVRRIARHSLVRWIQLFHTQHHYQCQTTAINQSLFLGTTQPWHTAVQDGCLRVPRLPTLRPCL